MNIEKNKEVIPAKITSKNQITIPKQVRNRLHLDKHDSLNFVIKSNGEITVENDKNFWRIVAEQEKKYGSVSTPEIDWGQDVGSEVID
ncbi:AbrB/MazE/SpoVT family DNA-binding domain-containing protein [Companilactobacillus hulinensis]|uniref:AbrB/MazE/SpoVT family DNA-binding domain-containing protein n=1 Tax=Companilactobacillus hulinensis TaxID=2486007 RepID=UPI002989B3E9|nr:type II toxin-antitoxin system PrlF family antitoxin [Companilactobacillus hulinensis]